MNDFIFHNPDKVYFGRKQMGHLPEEVSRLEKLGDETGVHTLRE